MTVELTFTGDVSGLTETEAETLISEVLAYHETTSSTSGTYTVANNSIRPSNDTGFDVHIGLVLTDADDADYPNVKDDLAGAIAGLSIDFGTESEIKDELSGTMK